MSQPAMIHEDESGLSARTAYWENFYASQTAQIPPPPSQFAAFVMSEFPTVKNLVEIGCGNGRDAEFFSAYGMNVLATDASAEAVALCEGRRKNDRASYRNFSLGDSPQDIEQFLKNNSPAVLYARFFLHAISDEEQGVFFDLAANALQSGSYIALEYRIIGDEQIEKTFGTTHYRRFVNHGDICALLQARNFEIIYEIHGTGFAKYKSEDARVGRCIAKKI